MKVLFAGGGTGGHLFPGLSIAKEIKNKYENAELLFAGDKNRIEGTLVQENGFQFKPVTTFQMRKRFALKNVWFFISLVIGVCQSLMILIRFKPDVVIGLGGYISVAPVIAGKLLRIPLIIHEQNFSSGRANKFLAKFVDRVAVSFESSLRFFDKDKGVFTGNFVRDNIKVDIAKNDARAHFGLNSDLFTILVVGGSRGAHRLNMMVLDNVRYLKEAIGETKIQMIHLAGEEDEDAVCKKYQDEGIMNHSVAFLNDMGIAYKACDLVICRGGGTTMAELVYLGIPSIIVPFPYAVGDHQSENARFLERHNGAIVIQEKELSGEKLSKRIIHYFENPDDLKEMAENSLYVGKKDALDSMIKLIEILITK